MSVSIEEPTQVVNLCLDENVRVRMKGDKLLMGKLHAFDQHMNLVLGEVTEKHTILEIAPDTPGRPSTGNAIETIVERRFDLLFVRGDSIVMIAPLPSK